MLSDSDRAFIESVDRDLQKGETWQSIADAHGIPLSTLYLRVKAMGYRTSKRLVPIHAPVLDTDHQAA